MKRNRILVLLLVACLLLQSVPVLAAEDTPAVVVANVTAIPGGVAEVTVSLENNPGIIAAKLKVHYDSSLLTLTEVKDAGKLGDPVHKDKLEAPYVLCWANDTASADLTYSGVVATLVFQVAEDAPEGELPITITYDYDNYDFANFDMQKVYFDIQDGAVKVCNDLPQEPANELKDFEHKLTEDGIVILSYLGDDASLVIASSYEIDGKSYPVVEIAGDACYENEVLESVVIPETVRLVGVAAFYDCENLLDVTVLGKNTEIGEVALGCYSYSRRVDGILEGFVLKAPLDSLAQSYAETVAEEIEWDTPMTFLPVLAFAGGSLVLHSDLSVNYKVSKSLLDDYGYTDPYVVFEMNGKKVKVDSYKLSGERYVFSFESITPDRMCDQISGTLYATYNGQLCRSQTRNYSVVEYCYSMLELYGSVTGYDELRTLLVDLLRYGTASQNYTGYMANGLADSKLTQEQTAWGTSGDPALASVLDTAYETVENPKAHWLAGGLDLQKAVTVRFKLAAQTLEGLSVRIKADGFGTIEIPAKEFVPVEGGYNVYFSGLNAAKMRNKIYVTVYEGDTPVSNTACYSIESYAFEKQNDGTLGELVKAMIRYGDSAKAYAN